MNYHEFYLVSGQASERVTFGQIRLSIRTMLRMMFARVSVVILMRMCCGFCFQVLTGIVVRLRSHEDLGRVGCVM